MLVSFCELDELREVTSDSRGLPADARRASLQWKNNATA